MLCSAPRVPSWMARSRSRAPSMSGPAGRRWSRPGWCRAYRRDPPHRHRDRRDQRGLEVARPARRGSGAGLPADGQHHVVDGGPGGVLQPLDVGSAIADGDLATAADRAVERGPGCGEAAAPSGLGGPVGVLVRTPHVGGGRCAGSRVDSMGRHRALMSSALGRPWRRPALAVGSGRARTPGRRGRRARRLPTCRRPSNGASWR